MTSTQRVRRKLPGQRMNLAITVVLFVLLGIGFSLIVPPFETPDEPFHYAFARHIAQGNGLPIQAAEETGPWAQEGSQAPLYYLLAGWLTAGIDQSDFETLAVRNPRANIGDPLYPGNKNFMLYSGVRHPLVGANLALHVGRWLSLLLGVITLFCTYSTARLATPPYINPRHLALSITAILFVAFIPQFIFISASFSNDSMIIAAAAIVIYWLARLLARPTEEALLPWEWIVLGLLLGIAALSKLQGLGLFLLAAAVGVGIMWQRQDRWLPLRIFPLVALPALLVAGWWYWRNYALYGDWLGISHLLEINGQRIDPLTFGGFWREFRGLRYSFWGLFGWFNILLPGWFYLLMDVITLLGAAAVSIVFSISLSQQNFRLRQRADRRVRLMLLLWIVLSLLLMFYWMVQATGSQGRLLMPALSAIGIMVALGLTAWLDLLSPRIVTGIWIALAAVMVAMSVTSLTSLLPSSYRQPQPTAAIPDEATSVDIEYGDAGELRLDALIVDGARFRPGDDVPVTLYMHSTRSVGNRELFVQLLDEKGEQIANITSHPGWGRNPVSLWRTNAIYPDPYLLRISGPVDNRSPLLADLYVGFINPGVAHAPLTPMTARDAQGNEITPFVGSVVVAPHGAPELDEFDLQEAAARFSNVIDLVGIPSASADKLVVTAGTTLTVPLMWKSVVSIATDYTAFVHLLDADGHRVAGYDQAPAGERFPTSHWQRDDVIVSGFPLELPPDLAAGEYQLWTGLYASGSGGAVRLPVTTVESLPRGDGQVMIGTVTVE